MTPPSDSVVLHSSWRGFATSLLGAGIILAVGAASTSLTGGAVGSLILLAIGLTLFAVVAFDYPIAAEFDADGVTRRPLLRRHRLAWSDAQQLTRVRPGIAAAARSLKPGGLALRVGRRRYLLVDQCESLEEFERLVELLERDDREIGLDELIIPPVDIDPTYIYRRAKWQHQSDG